jgi:hypothetical protein
LLSSATYVALNLAACLYRIDEFISTFSLTTLFFKRFLLF